MSVAFRAEESGVLRLKAALLRWLYHKVWKCFSVIAVASLSDDIHASVNKAFVKLYWWIQDITHYDAWTGLPLSITMWRSNYVLIIMTCSSLWSIRISIYCSICEIIADNYLCNDPSARCSHLDTDSTLTTKPGRWRFRDQCSSLAQRKGSYQL